MIPPLMLAMLILDEYEMMWDSVLGVHETGCAEESDALSVQLQEASEDLELYGYPDLEWYPRRRDMTTTHEMLSAPRGWRGTNC